MRSGSIVAAIHRFPDDPLLRLSVFADKFGKGSVDLALTVFAIEVDRRKIAYFW